MAGVMNGNPDYSQLVPEYADYVRRELSVLQKILRELGPPKSASFKRVLPNGQDVYSIVFATGTRDLEVLLAPDGRIQQTMFNR